MPSDSDRHRFEVGIGDISILAALDPANKEKAIATVLKYNRETPEEIVRQQLPATRILMMPTPDFEFGRIDAAAWKQTEAIMLSQKLISGPVNVEKWLVSIND